MTCILDRKLHSKQSSGPANFHRKATRKLGPRRRTKRRELYVWGQRGLQPMEQLPPEYIVSSTKKKPRRIPRLHYCVAVSAETLYSYAVKHRLVPHLPYSNIETSRYCGMIEAVQRLARLSGAILFLREPLWKADESLLVARYDNYSYSYHMDEKGAPPDDQVFDIIRRELATTATPKWYQAME